MELAEVADAGKLGTFDEFLANLVLRSRHLDEVLGDELLHKLLVVLGLDADVHLVPLLDPVLQVRLVAELVHIHGVITS